jgi:ubiquinone/menaquinone biosynthesis C-methylase UbiE
MIDKHAAFAGSIPQRYDEYLGPLLFEPWAIDLVSRLTIAPGDAVLELACGTGVLTQHLTAKLPLGASLTATDLDESMLAVAQRKIDPVEPVTWQTADACALPFGDDWFDTVVCQFGLMFFPDKPLALREVRRVLQPSGTFVFNVWDSLDVNPFGRIGLEVLSRFFASDPPTFCQMPWDMHDTATTTRLLEEAGFEDIHYTTQSRDARAPSTHHVATGMVTGHPVLHDIRERATAPADVIIAALIERLTAEFGAGPLTMPMRAHIFTAERP